MQKIVNILLAGVLAWVLFGADGIAAQAHDRPFGQALSVDCSAADEWRCCRACNSDLDFPRQCGAETVRTGGSAATGSPVMSARAGLRGSASGVREDGWRMLYPFVKFSPLFACDRAVDRYVYRLRRLLI